MRTVRTLAGLAVLALSTVAGSGPPRATAAGLRETEVSFAGAGGVVLSGTILAPAAPAPPRSRPGMVMVAGAGNRGRHELRDEAEAYARNGVVTLFYDKRTAGYSLLQRDYAVLAADALAGLRALRASGDVDPGRIGLWGLSEGAWVAPLAANRSAEVRFLVTVGAIGVSPARQTAWAYGEFLRHRGVSGSLSRTMRVTAVRTAIDAGAFPEARFDPVPAWERVHQPVLAEWGEFDREALPAESSRIISGALERGGNTRHTIRFVPGVRHNLNLTRDGGFDRIERLPAGYAVTEARWIRGLARGVAAVDPGPAPRQDRHSAAVRAPAWYEAAPLQLLVLAALAIAGVSYPVIGAAGRGLGRPAGPSLAAARWSAGALLSAVAGLPLYLVFLMATAAQVIGPVVGGRPVPWLGLHLLSAGVVAGTLATAASWWRRRRDLPLLARVRLGVLVGAGVLFIPWAAYWGLLVP